MVIAPTRLKIQPSNLTSLFPGTVQARPPIFLENGVWPGSHDPLNFWALNANCSNMVKGTDFKFDKHVHRDIPHMIVKIFFRKVGVSRVK